MESTHAIFQLIITLFINRCTHNHVGPQSQVEKTASERISQILTEDDGKWETIRLSLLTQIVEIILKTHMDLIDMCERVIARRR